MYDKVVELAEENLLAISKEAAKLIHAEKNPNYMSIPLDILAERLIPTFQMQLRYLRSGDVEEWRATCTKLVEDRVRQGSDYQQVIRAGELMVQCLYEFLERELSKQSTFDGLSTTRLLATIQRRLQGLSVVATAAATAVGIKAKTNKPNS